MSKVRASLSVLALAFALPAAACVQSGYFEKDAFYNRHAGYSLDYGDKSRRAFMPEPWKLDNFTLDRHGAPLEPKSSAAYRHEYEFERDDGTTFNETVDLYDLRFVHAETNAVVWLRSIPLSTRAAERSLRVVAEEYVEGLSGTGFFAMDAGPVKVGAQQYATRILSQREGTIEGEPAFEVKLELANVDQLRLDPNARSAMARVVFARTNFRYHAKGFGARDAALPERWMIGYANNPTDFARQEPDFERFLALFQPKFGAPVPASSASGSAPPAAGSASPPPAAASSGASM